jgi:hypothetical protein
MHSRIDAAIPVVAQAVRACVMLDWAMLRNSLMMARLQSAFNLVEVQAEE